MLLPDDLLNYTPADALLTPTGVQQAEDAHNKWLSEVRFVGDVQPVIGAYYLPDTLRDSGSDCLLFQPSHPGCAYARDHLGQYHAPG
jgi:hypothetical protein